MATRIVKMELEPENKEFEVGDVIRVTRYVHRDLTVGKDYKVEEKSESGWPVVIDDIGDRHSIRPESVRLAIDVEKQKAEQKAEKELLDQEMSEKLPNWGLFS